MKKNILLTGAAGFIGFHLSKKLCELGFNVIGVDNLNDYFYHKGIHAKLQLLIFQRLKKVIF